MNKKSKSFWIYTIILFTVALVLVLLSYGMYGNTKDYKSNIQTLQTENETLKAEKTKNEVMLSGLEEKVRQLTAELEEYRGGTYADAVEAIYNADGACAREEWAEAKSILDAVDPEILKPQILGAYHRVKNKITNNLD